MDKLADAFDMVPQAPITQDIVPIQEGAQKISDDSNFARHNLKTLIATTNRAMDSALELAVQSESPRAFEVLSNLINVAADLNTKLMDVHQREQKMSGKAPEDQVKTVTNNNVVFHGTTDQLNDLIMKRLNGNKNETL